MASTLSRSRPRVRSSVSTAYACGLLGCGLGRPDLPGAVAAANQAFEALAVLERVHRRPEAVVLVREQLAVGDQPV